MACVNKHSTGPHQTHRAPPYTQPDHTGAPWTPPGDMEVCGRDAVACGSDVGACRSDVGLMLVHLGTM